MFRPAILLSFISVINHIAIKTANTCNFYFEYLFHIARAQKKIIVKKLEKQVQLHFLHDKMIVRVSKWNNTDKAKQTFC